MAVKEAAVRLDIKDGGFQRGIRTATDAVRRGAKTMGGALRSELSAGAKGGLDAMKGMFSRIKSGFSSVAGLAGGIGLGALVKGAMDADTQYRKLAFTVSASSGKLVDHNALMKQAQGLAARWGISTEQLGGAMEAVYDTVGDLDYAAMTLEDIAVAARASGHNVQTIAPLVAEMNRQFGVTAEEVPEALASMLDLGTRGGLSVEELSAQMGMLGSLASVAGESGADGMKRIVAMANNMSAASGRARTAVSDLNAVLATMMDANTLKRLEKELQLDIDKKDLSAVDRLGQVLQATKGDAGALTKIFGKDLGATVARFSQLLPDAKDFDSQVNKLAATALDASAVMKRANENRKTAEAQISIGIERLKAAFTKPEIIDALTKLASTLPALADVIAEVVSIIAENPMTAMATGMAFSFGKGALGAMLTSSITSGGTAAAGAMKGGIVSGGGLAGAAIAAAFAAAAVTAAYEQASSLKKELGSESWWDVPGDLVRAVTAAEDKSKTDAELVRMGEEQRVQAERAWTPGTELKGDAPFIMAGKQVYLTEERTGPKGEFQTVARATRTLEGGGLAAAIEAIANAQAKTGVTALGATAPVPGAGLPSLRRAPPKQEDVAAQASANARALGAELTNKRLTMRLENVPELATAIANAMPKTQPKGSDEVP